MPAAAIAGAVATIGGSVIAAGSAKSAANKAAAAQQAANEQAIAAQQAQYQQTRSDLMPWQTAGKSALSGQSDLLGLNGTAAQQAAITNLQGSPLYQSLFGNGQNTILANAAATGGLRGGNTQRSLADFGRDTLAGVYQSQLANLGGVSEQGQNAAAQTGQFGANATNQVSALLSGTGTAQANAALTAGGANVGATNSIVSALTRAINNLGGDGISSATLSRLTPSAASVIANTPEIF